MAKFTLVVFKNRQLQNKDYTIFVKLTHKGKKSFKATEFTCTSKDINDTGVVTNYKVIAKVYTEFLEKWEEDLSKIEKIENKTCDEIIKIITNRETFTDTNDLDFFEFAEQHTNFVRESGRNGSADKVCTLAEQIMKRYKGNVRLLNFQSRYSELDTFIRAINEGLKSLTDEMEITRFTYYSARHSWATIARNECGISKDDVDMCLNHTSANKMADKYIKKSWDILDKANEKVLEYVFGSVEWIK